MAPKSAIGKKKKSPYMQFCADKRSEWKARSTRCPCPSPCAAHMPPLTLTRARHLIRFANDSFFAVARPLARSTLFRSRVRCSARRGRPCPRPTRSRAGTSTWRRSRRHSTVALLALPAFGEARALTIALRLALDCVCDSPFFRVLGLSTSQRERERARARTHTRSSKNI